MKMLRILLVVISVAQGLVVDEFFTPYIGASASNVKVYEGGGLSARHAHDLSCNFRTGTPCCWMNTADVTDEITWWQADGTTINKTLMNIPDSVFVEGSVIFAGHPQTSAARQALLVSCPIACQKGNGTLTLMHMQSKYTKLDVCTLPVGERKYAPNACATLDSSRTTSVVIEPAETVSDSDNCV